MGRKKDLLNDKELNLTESDISSATLPSDYAIRLQLARLREVEENAERLALDNKKKRIDINKTGCNLVYLDYAESEVNKVLAPIANIIKSLDQILATRLNLTGQQTAIVQDVVDDVLKQIASIEIKLKSTEEIDAEKSHISTVERETAIKEAAKSRKNRDKTISRK